VNPGCKVGVRFQTPSASVSSCQRDDRGAVSYGRRRAEIAER
jgi:hypothetical protein